MVKMTGVKIPEELYKKAMIKAANQGIYHFNTLVKTLLINYTAQEATLRTDEK